VTNVAHNVFLDLMAYGGIPLFLLYVSSLGIALISIFRVTSRNKSYDPIFVTLVATWVGFQAQSIISINQIGLAVWGWLLTGLLVGYEHQFRKEEITTANAKKLSNVNKRSTEVFSITLIATLGAAVGFVIALPPLSGDIKWYSVRTTGQLSQLEDALSGSYLAPLNSSMLANAVQLLESSKLPQLAVKYAREGVSFNPENIDSWKVLYFATDATKEEKSHARLELIRLDPLNPEWKKLA